MKNRKKLFICFIIYSVVMLWLLFGQRMLFVSYENYFEQLRYKINLIPFKTVAEYAEMYKTNVASLVRHAIINIGGNVITFIPLGFFLPALFEKLRKTKAMLLYSSAIIVAVEIIQYFTLLGSLDIDDFILNMAGILIGFLAFKGYQKLKN